MVRRAALTLAGFAIIAVAALGTTTVVTAAEAPSTVTIAAVGDIACKNPPATTARSASTTTSPARSHGATTTSSSCSATTSTSTASTRTSWRTTTCTSASCCRSRRRRRATTSTACVEGRRVLPLLRRPRAGAHGYYSFDLGAWHVISLDSTICPAGAECRPGPAVRVACRRSRSQRRPLHPRLLAPPALGPPEVPEGRLDGRLRVPAAANPCGTCSTPRAPTSCSRATTTTTRAGSRPTTGERRPRARHHPVHRRDRRAQPERLRGPPHPPGHLRPRPGEGVRAPAAELQPEGWSFRWISAPGQPDFLDEGVGTCH